MRTWFSRGALGRGVLLAVLAAVSVTGCADAGGLHDAGSAQPVTPHPSPSPLWPGTVGSAAASPAPTPGSPHPVPGVTVPEGDLHNVDARTLLLADQTQPLENFWLHSMNGCRTTSLCQVEPAQYRDLTGDGHLDLITAVLMPMARTAFLNVYTVQDGQAVPILSTEVQPGFSAETIGTDLVVHQLVTPLTERSTTYRWVPPRLSLVSQLTTPVAPPGGPTSPPADTTADALPEQSPAAPAPSATAGSTG
ncbi:hypothetical protein ABH930_007383 [Kitasatospora sp. GAS204A]|nr:hypothetical protein [Kitasatospora sp. GAS204B]